MSVPATAPRPEPPRPPPTAPHAADIVALDATVDGGAVASADRLGGIRLWTALDGTREPVVIRGPAPRQIALWRDSDGFALAAVDAARGVQVIRTTGAGTVRGRATVSGVPASEIASTPEGLLILRSDQTLDLVDAGGVLRSRLVPEPGSRIDSLVVRAGRILALVREDQQLHGRWVVVHRGARWGEATAKLPFPIARAVLSPDGTRLAVTRPRKLHPVLIDLAKGTAEKTPLCVSQAWPHDDGEERDETELLRSDSAPVPLGFVTDQLVACRVLNQLTWWGTDGEQRPISAGSLAVAHQAIAVTDGATIVSSGPNLALARPEVIRYLGYGVHELGGLRTTTAAVVIAGSDQRALLLDGALRERTRFELGHNRGTWLDFAALDERYGIAATMRRSLDRRTISYQLAVLDGLAPGVHQLLPYQARDREFAYAPDTRLLATRDGAMAMLLRYDPDRHTFGEPVRVGTAISPSRLALLDPRLAGGAVALEIDEAGGELVVGELRDAELVSGTTVQPRATYRVPGELRAVDPAGHLYVHRPADHDDVVVFARDLAVARLPGVAAMALRPSPDGGRVAAFDSPRLVLLTAAGEVRWDSAQWSGAAVDWTTAGELLVQFPSGVARLDLDTGAIVERRCGWGFGLSDVALSARDDSPSICEAER